MSKYAKEGMLSLVLTILAALVPLAIDLWRESRSAETVVQQPVHSIPQRQEQKRYRDVSYVGSPTCDPQPTSRYCPQQTSCSR